LLQTLFLGWCFGLRLALDVRPTNFVDDLGIAFVDDWVVSKEKGRYWLSDDIVGLVGSLAM